MTNEIFPKDMIKFEIESLGPIRDSVINFNPFLIFSGESNTGKSYALMAVYYFLYMLMDQKTLSKLTEKMFDYKKIESDLNSGKPVDLEYEDINGALLENVFNENINRFMAYMTGYESFSCNVKLKIKIPMVKFVYHIPNANPNYPESYAMSTKRIPVNNPKVNIITIYKSHIDDVKHYINYSYIEIINQLVFGKRSFNRFFFPPARGTLTALTPTLLKSFSEIGMYNEFIEGIDSVRHPYYGLIEDLRVQKELIEPLLTKLLNGKIKIERDSISYAVTSSNHELPLTASSSSVKELFPLYLLLNRVPMDELSICIEEPEAHLHPELQRNTALLLSYIINNGGFIQATTHSDFFMNQINNLLKLHFLKNKNQERFEAALKKTGIEEKFVLNPNDVGAYYFEKVSDQVQIKKLEISEKGIPMESFKGAFDHSVKETRDLREALADDDE